MTKVLLLLLGGAVGTYLRYVISIWVRHQSWGQSFPFGTLIINVSGSFILAASAVFILERLPPHYEDWFLLIGTGFCGGFTTFSTFELETYQLVRAGNWWLVLAYVGGSVLAGFLGVLLGIGLVHWFFPPP